MQTTHYFLLPLSQTWLLCSAFSTCSGWIKIWMTHSYLEKSWICWLAAENPVTKSSLLILPMVVPSLKNFCHEIHISHLAIETPLSIPVLKKTVKPLLHIKCILVSGIHLYSAFLPLWTIVFFTHSHSHTDGDIQVTGTATGNNSGSISCSRTLWLLDYSTFVPSLCVTYKCSL